MLPPLKGSYFMPLIHAGNSVIKAMRSPLTTVYTAGRHPAYPEPWFLRGTKTARRGVIWRISSVIQILYLKNNPDKEWRQNERQRNRLARAA